MRSPKASTPGGTDAGVGTLVLLVGAMCFIHVVSQFLRSSVGVIAPDLARDLGLGATGIGLLSSAFFLGFAGAQVPLGVAIDRWGPRLTMSVSMGIAVLGVILFAVAQSPEFLVFARTLTGIGCASFFMGPLAIYSRWFPPERFSTLVGIQLGVSGLGVIGATAPLAYSTGAIGWRMSFLAVAAIAALIGLFVWLVTRDDPPGRERPKSGESLRESFSGLAEVVRVPSFVAVFAMQFAGYSTFLTVFGLWAGPYLAHVYGYDLDRRGNVLFVLAIVHLIASATWGPADRLFRSYKIPATIGAGMTVVSLIWIASVGKPSEAMLLVWFVVFGFFASCTAVITAHGRSLFPVAFVGRGLTLMNLGTMGGVFVMQAATGTVMGLFDAPGGVYPIEAYRAAFAVLAGVLGVCTLIYLASREPAR
ncbi:MAG: MFS transporter [Bradyrhizobiaceae bacterium]|nr:MFS transporter [Bradyrhizobiaceae bacterium]